MIRIFSITQALALRGGMPDLAIIRSLQFQGNGYDPEIHGHILVLEPGDNINKAKEIGEDGLFIDGIPNFEFVEAHPDADGVVFEIVLALDNERTVAIIVRQEYLDADLAKALLDHSSPSQPTERSQP